MKIIYVGRAATWGIDLRAPNVASRQRPGAHLLHYQRGVRLLAKWLRVLRPPASTEVSITTITVSTEAAVLDELGRISLPLDCAIAASPAQKGNEAKCHRAELTSTNTPLLVEFSR